MTNIEISRREPGQPGLYIMRWKGKTGLARVVGSQKVGFKIISPTDTAETYMRDIPLDGKIPLDAYFSEPLAIVQV